MYEMIEADAKGILYQCQCGLKVRSAYPPERVHHQCPLAPSITPILVRLAEITNHPEILDRPDSYARAAQLWAAGIPGELEPFETRDDSEVDFIQTLCQTSGCGKLRDGVCKPSCGPGMIIEVKARMASEGCPGHCRRW